jgi:hypothetical protein
MERRTKNEEGRIESVVSEVMTKVCGMVRYGMIF